MQRIGFLYFVCKSTSTSKSSTREALANKILRDLKRLEPVPPERRESMYLYLERLKTSGDRNEYAKAKTYDIVQSQDLLLEDPRLPSQTGRVTKEVAVDFVDEAVEWHLLRDSNYTLTNRGAAMLHLWESIPSNQPLLLSGAARHACTFWYIDTDGDALRMIYERLPTQLETVKREQIGEAAEAAIRDLLHGEQRASRLDRPRRTRLMQLYKAITEQKGRASGSGRTLYQQATIRGEHPADLGLVTKPVPFRYQYQVPDNSLVRKLASTFKGSWRMDLQAHTLNRFLAQHE